MSPKAKPRPQPASSTRRLFEQQPTQQFAELGLLTATEPEWPGWPKAATSNANRRTTNFPARREIEDVLNRSDRRWASSTNPWWHPIGGDHVIGMEPHRDLGPHRQAHHALGATRPSVEWQSVLCLGTNFDQRQSVKENQIQLGNEKEKTVDYFGSPCKWLGVTFRAQKPYPARTSKNDTTRDAGNGDFGNAATPTSEATNT